MDTPPPAEQPAVRPQQQQSHLAPVNVRYSEFLKMVDSDQVEKVAFTADGSQLYALGKDGERIKIEALPDDTTLLTQLTDHKVRESRKLFRKLLCLLGPEF